MLRVRGWDILNNTFDFYFALLKSTSCLIEPHYLPSLEYFCALLRFDKLILEKNQHYIKQSFRNRCYINTANGVEMLVVPLSEKHGKVQLKDIRIDYTKKWQNNHWRGIQSAYAKAPFFEHYSDALKQIIFSDHQFLYDLNLALLSFCLRSMNLEREISETVSYEKTFGGDIYDLRSAITPKEPYSGRPYYKPMAYYQVFGSAFAENLSFVDLLFSMGPGSLAILRASQKEILNK